MRVCGPAVLSVMLAVLSFGPAFAVQPDEVLSDAGLEARARGLSHNLRCLVCQNQSIDDSDAPLARDLRVLVRERLTAGDSDAAVIDYVVQRYGDFVLLKPPLKPSTVILWLSPLFLLAAGLWLSRGLFGSRAGLANDAALSDEERARLAEVLDEPKPKSSDRVL